MGEPVSAFDSLNKLWTKNDDKNGAASGKKLKKGLLQAINEVVSEMSYCCENICTRATDLISPQDVLIVHNHAGSATWSAFLDAARKTRKRSMMIVVHKSECDATPDFASPIQLYDVGTRMCEATKPDKEFAPSMMCDLFTPSLEQCPSLLAIFLEQMGETLRTLQYTPLYGIQDALDTYAFSLQPIYGSVTARIMSQMSNVQEEYRRSEASALTGLLMHLMGKSGSFTGACSGQSSINGAIGDTSDTCTGGLLICLSAQRHNVPVYVLVAFYKITPFFVPDEKMVNLNKAPGLPFSHAASFAGLVEVVRPTYDVIPASLVTLYVSNSASILPSHVYRLIGDYYHPEDVADC
ncbi:hypothetical protein KIN20_017413 [Parelaphostrongylus tenuis]|uniref:Translation initiation factor eIF2B subunit beta n=1 Tax=Parelaphostrongylus tenuis TaxID=148309 RepID=A0AAD5MZV6_PARTN|nr:hypothetical protein KIN20_017413 [Parelaphostrongylus tenuis]